MKQYKVVQVNSPEAFETSLNELAQAGWKIIASNMAPLADAAEDDFVYFALLESAPIEEELKQMMEENINEMDALDGLDSLDNVDLSPSAN